MARKSHTQRRDEALEHTDTDGWYAAQASKIAALPSQRPEAIRARDQKNFKLRRHSTYYRVDRRPPNKSSKAARAELKALEDEIRARGNHPDHIIAWRHPQLRGLHTIENIQELTPRQNKIKGQRLLLTKAEIQAHIDAGRAVRPEDVDEDGSRTGTPGAVDWGRYPQHLVREDV